MDRRTPPAQLCYFVAEDGRVLLAAIARLARNNHADLVIFDERNATGTRYLPDVPYAREVPDQDMERVSWHWPDPATEGAFNAQ